jgi:sodium/potassium-transporting ATPase subunit alpha
MSVVRIICGMEESDMIQCHKLNDAENEAFAEMVRVCAMCNRATFDASTVNLPIAQRKTIGDASDSGILRFAEEFISCSEQRAKHPLLLEVPFNSKNKYMLNIWNFDNTSTLYMKGAAEIIINRCSQVVMPNGNIEPLTPQMREKLIEYQESFAGNGERVLGCCKQSLIQDPNFVFDAESENFQLTNLTFVGLISLMDPPREDVFDAVQVCKKASIKVIMVTGDHPATAVAIARMVGIVTKEHVTEVTGNDILHQNDDESDIEDRVLTIRGPSVDIFNSDTWDCIFRHNEIVFARTSPQHKLQIVMQCQKRGHVVAVTGDGVNDAPALKQSNCGVCMGSGSEVAREAASIVLTDSKFSSIVVAIENGRMVFDNMKVC